MLIKRGVVWGALLFSGVIYFAGLLSQLLRAVGREAPGIEAVALCAGGLLFAAVWVACHDRFERTLDRHLFRRPDYGRLILEIGREVRRWADPQTLVADATTRLRGALEASHVRFVKHSPPGALATEPGPATGPQPSDASEVAAVIPVATDEREWGRLVFGPRPRGQTYRSEDLRFLLTVGNQIADRLDDFARQDERQAREQQLRELSLRSELKALRAQINPHFLFNALNTLAGMARHEPREAERTVLDLARVFHFVLEASRQEAVTLGEEVDFVAAYLAIEQARFRDRLRYEIQVSEELRQMLIQPLVENAVRHGIFPAPEGGAVIVRARLGGERLIVTVSDDGVGFDPARRRGRDDGGIGLDNVRERVERLSGPGRWRLDSAPGRGTRAEFEIHVGEAVACARPPKARNIGQSGPQPRDRVGRSS